MKNLFILLFALGLGFSFAQDVELYGDFAFMKDIDVMTDANASFIFTLEVDAPNHREGGLVFRCAPEGLDIYLIADEYLDNVAGQNVIYRFDDGEATKRNWFFSTDGDTLFAPKANRSELIDLFANSEQFAIRVQDYQGTDYTYIFKLGGFEDALDQLGCTENLEG